MALFVVCATAWDSEYIESKMRIYGVFSSEQLAKDAIELFVERFIKKSEDDDQGENDLESFYDEYRANFKIEVIGGVDDLGLFTGLPCF